MKKERKKGRRKVRITLLIISLLGVVRLSTQPLEVQRMINMVIYKNKIINVIFNFGDSSHVINVLKIFLLL